MESQLELNSERIRLLEKFKQALPDLVLAESSTWGVVYQDGALSHKIKRLIALGIALRAGCKNCILGHTLRAIELGASKEEILETISVNVTMSGTTGIGEGLRVLKLLEEVEKL